MTFGLSLLRVAVGGAGSGEGGCAGGRLEELVQRGAEPRGDGLVALGDAQPRLALGGQLPQPLLQLRVAAAGAVQLGLRHSVELAGPPPPLELAGLLRLREELPRGARPGGTCGTARG